MYHSSCTSDCSSASSRVNRGILPGHIIAILALCAGLFSTLTAWAQPVVTVNIQSKLVGSASGKWANPGNVIGAPDNNCANMGAVDKANLTNNFGFSIPGDATITGVKAFVKAGEQSDQNVGIQLASNASIEPPTTIGDQRSLFINGVGSGSCVATEVNSIGDTLDDWGLNSLSPAVVNSVEFGLVFTKLETSSVKVDAVCLQITYEDDAQVATTEECFTVPPSETNTITVVKKVLGTPPESGWDFVLAGEDESNFSIAAEGGFETFTELEDDTYTITEISKKGYNVVSECFIDDVSVAEGDEVISVDVAEGEFANCVFTNIFNSVEDGPGTRATFRVTKDFTDDNPSEVLVALDCNTGLILDQSKLISEGDDVTFVVTEFDPGELNCDVSEEVPEGYSPSYDASILDGQANEPTDDDTGCQFKDVSGGGFQCSIVNTPDPVDVVIDKVWVIEGSGGDGVDTGYELTLYCDAEIVDGSRKCRRPIGDDVNGQGGGSPVWCINFEGNDSDTFTGQVIPEYPDSNCSVEERANDSSVEIDDDDCQDLVVSAGQGDSCVVTNTVFFEGIPTLGHYGKLLLVMLMLGMGIMGYRRIGS